MKYFILIVVLINWQLKIFAQHFTTFLNPQNSTKNFKLQFDFQKLDSVKSYRLQFFTDTTDISLLHPNYVLIGIEKQTDRQKLFVYADRNLQCDATIVPDREQKNYKVKRTPFITIHGNIYYDMFYQSYIDTPFMQHDIYQHTLSTYLDVTIKDKYPLRVSFTTRFSNTSLFKKFTGINLQFNSQEFKNELIEKAKSWMLTQLVTRTQLDSIRNLLDSKVKELSALRNSQITSSVLQKSVEAKEAELVKEKFGSDTSATGKAAGVTENAMVLKNQQLNKTLINVLQQKAVAIARTKIDTAGSKTKEKDSGYINRIDSIRDALMVALKRKEEKADSLYQLYQTKKQKIDSLEKEIKRLEGAYLKAKELYGKDWQSNVSYLMQQKNNNSILTRIDSLHIPDTVLPKGYRRLLAFKSFGIGRTMINYSELTATNVSINGIQAEYNPHNYYAFATGAVDYVFRDFVINDNRPKQYLNIVRFGKDIRAVNSVIVTYYFGKKQIYNYISYSDSTQLSYLPNYKLMGFSLEGKYKLTQNSILTIEGAKSSLPYFNRSQTKQSLFASTISLKDRSNEAYSIKLQSYIPETQTRINAYYKRVGANFQSFTLYTTGSTQNIWAVKVDQTLFKRKLALSGSIKTNDYSNPYLQTYKSNTVFKAIQATLNIKKLPVVSIGYFPSAQLIKYNDALYQENLFYTLVGNVSHFYMHKGVMFNSFLSYTQFYNKHADSDFVYFNTKNISLSEHINFAKYSLQGCLSLSSNTLYKLYAAEAGMQYKVKEWFTFGCGLKYNKQTFFNIQQVGYNLNTTLRIKTPGEFRLYWDKGFMPGNNRQLVENNVGRITYFKTF
jgi:hypothetical protein